MGVVWVTLVVVAGGNEASDLGSYPASCTLVCLWVVLFPSTCYTKNLPASAQRPQRPPRTHTHTHTHTHISHILQLSTPEASRNASPIQPLTNPPTVPTHPHSPPHPIMALLCSPCTPSHPHTLTRVRRASRGALPSCSLSCTQNPCARSCRTSCTPSPWQE